jgi:hypothetical protein
VSYRPQFAFTGRRGFRDEQFHYSFDATNVPVLGTAILAGQRVENITLQLQNDCEFILRALKVQAAADTVSGLYCTIQDPFSNYLSAVPLPLGNYITGGGAVSVGRFAVPFEAEVFAPIGGFFRLDLWNISTGSITPPAFTLLGVNRRNLFERRAA